MKNYEGKHHYDVMALLKLFKQFSHLNKGQELMVIDTEVKPFLITEKFVNNIPFIQIHLPSYLCHIGLLIISIETNIDYFHSIFYLFKIIMDHLLHCYLCPLFQTCPLFHLLIACQNVSVMSFIESMP